ncbi:MAG: 5'-deoxynucleotidase, partial [Clostridia bacterium]|nr:5'-deoxynucleotidase [Clostridia bacterium]
EDLQDVFSSLLTGCDDEELAPLVKAADKLSALIKCIEERKAGNTEFSEAEAATRKRILAANIPEADVFLDEFIPAYELTLDRL